MSVIEQYRARLRAAAERMSSLQDALVAERSRHRPAIAVIGMACRFPKDYRDPESFFDGLLEGRDSVSTSSRPGAHRRAGYLDQVRSFDAAFFGITPREAAALDPQQRLLLEVTWEALEHAGCPPSRIAHDPVGVFVGLTSSDYLELSLASAERDIYSLTGNGHCFAAGRIAYTLGFQGPALTIDTACSSALVAIHQATRSLRDGESTIAIAGAANLLLSPSTSMLLEQSGALSPEDRCKAFDAAADGFVRGEGVGVVVLERLDDALRRGDPVLAVIRGSAVNQDGRSTGLTAPNVRAQQDMLRRALADAGLRPKDVGFIETHGTGTALGDPIELAALHEVYGDTPCVLGAVKSNVGHLEAAAGMAGFIKAVGCLQRRVIPPNLHFQRLNPHAASTGAGFVLPTAPHPWPSTSAPRRAGVSAFGMSGTNAHVLLEQAPATDEPP
ncbi:MAG: polyketide synthase, partial [Myxococcales bacterium]|nr:polyketide synthase [Myxococcales bacterium]